MSIISWSVFGLIVGFLTSYLDKSSRKNLPVLLSGMLMGVLGAVTGGFLSSLIFGFNLNHFNLIPLLSAGVSSILLLFVSRSFLES